MRALRAATALFALAVLLATAGCELEEASGKDKNDVLKQTEAACKSLDEKLAKLVRPIDLYELAIFYEQAAGYIDTTLEKLDSLDPPDADLPDWNEYVGGIRLQRDLLREAADAAVDRRPKKVRNAEREFRRMRVRTNTAGVKYGLERKCVALPS